MCDLLIFGGTSEGRILAEYCAGKNINTYVSTATEYGSELVISSEHIHPLTGRMDMTQITDFILLHKIKTVIDATHPYALEITQNIRKACEIHSIEYIRIIREAHVHIDNAEYFDNFSELITYLNANDGNILVTTGSKNLGCFRDIKNYKERCTIRILISEGIIKNCFELGFHNIIAGKGPFSVEQNIQHINESNARFLVTKDSGNTGGFAEKVTAAEKLGIKLLIIKRPEESGITLEEAKKILTEKYNG